MIAHVASVGLHVGQVVPADFAANPIFVAPQVRFDVLVHRIPSTESFRANWANFGVIGRVGVVKVVFQSCIVDELLAAVLHRTQEHRLYVVEDMDAQQVVADHELPREGLRAIVAFLKETIS